MVHALLDVSWFRCIREKGENILGDIDDPCHMALNGSTGEEEVDLVV